MKSILLSIKPQYVAKILNGEKTIEVRKQFPKNYVGWVYIYCTKDKNNLLHKNCANIWWVEDKYFQKKNKRLGIERQPIYNGKVVARFWCDKVSEIRRFMESDHGEFDFAYWDTKHFPDIENIETKSCLTTSELDNYARTKGKIDSVKLYAIHITKLEIFDEPKELSEFKRVPYEKCNKKDKNGKVYCGKCPYGYEDGYYCECKYNKPLKAPQNLMFIDTD